MLFHVLWTLSALTAVVFAAAACEADRAGRARGLVPGAAGFVAGIGVGVFASPSPAVVGLIAAAVAAILLLRPRARLLAGGAAGVLAALGGMLLTSRGVPAAIAMGTAVALPVTSALLAARRPAFAPALLREEALLVLLPVSLAVSAAPVVLQGWASGLDLNSAAHPVALNQIPSWVATTLGAAAVLGAASRLWSRK